MQRDRQHSPHPPLLARIRQSIWRDPWPTSEVGRIRHVLNDLILHLHATKVPRRALKATYSYGLGILGIVAFLVLVSTGVLLLFVYVPIPAEAYGSIQRLETDIWMGQLIRNLHHWSGNLLLVVAVLHMLRVFFTAAFHPPREFNWLLGWLLLALIAFSNFTGYLLPWDQLSYWATTIATSMISYVPVVGQGLHDWVIGGTEIGDYTLRTFYAFHIVILPLSVTVLISYHIWRVRKDSFSLPRAVDEPPLDRRKIERVTTIPHLVNLEVGLGLVTLALMIAWATWVNAPLEAAANPGHPPNPAKAAWYFMGFQELLLHFHAAYVTLAFPGLAALGLFLLPYLDWNPARDPDVIGIWFRSRRGRWLAAWSALLGIGLTVAFVVVDEYWLDLPDLLPGLSPSISNGLLPLVIMLGGLAAYWHGLRLRGATRAERNQAIFTLLLAAFVALTVIGIFFRGENMELVWPWNR